MDRNNFHNTTRAVQALRAALESGIPYGSSLLPLDILIAVSVKKNDGKSLTVRQLMATVPNSATGIRYNLNRLVADGWIERTRSEQDRRTVFLIPTAKTLKAFEAIADSL